VRCEFCGVGFGFFAASRSRVSALRSEWQRFFQGASQSLRISPQDSQVKEEGRPVERPSRHLPRESNYAEREKSFKSFMGEPGLDSSRPVSV
jgi:hypothetical protein